MQQLILHPNPQETPPIEIPPVVKRIGGIVRELGIGALGGFACYWVTLLLDKIGLVQKLPGPSITYLWNHVRAGVAGVAILEAMRLTYDLGMLLLGERKHHENLAQPEQASLGARLRHHSWKVISTVEKLQERIDLIFSRIFNIRTEKEIQEKNIQNLDLRFMEIVRLAFKEQIQQSVMTVIPQELGVYVVESLGYAILGGHLFPWLHGLNFLTGIIYKVGEERNKQYVEEARIERKIKALKKQLGKEDVQDISLAKLEAELEEKKMKKELGKEDHEAIGLDQLREEVQDKREQENKMYCDLLAAMYPTEYAILEEHPQQPFLEEKEVAENLEEQKDKRLMYILDGDEIEKEALPYRKYPNYKHTIFSSEDRFAKAQGPVLSVEEAILLEQENLPPNFYIAKDH